MQGKYEKYRKRLTDEKINTNCNPMDLLDGQNVVYWKPSCWDDLVFLMGCSEIIGEVADKIT